MDLHPDFKDLLVEFDRFGVKYALLGGYAVGYHSEPRATMLGDLTVPVLTIDDLIANKRAAKRPQDLADVAVLERARGK
jgi:hypothetical protein